MLEISIICVIALALAYWMALFLMGRREDVLHGNFIRSAPRTEPNRAAATSTGAARVVAPSPLAAPRVLPLKIPEVAQPTAVELMPAAVGVGPGEASVREDAPAVAPDLAPTAVQRASVAERVRAMSARIDASRPTPAGPPQRPATPSPAQPEILHSLLEIIKRDLGEAATK